MDLYNEIITNISKKVYNIISESIDFDTDDNDDDIINNDIIIEHFKECALNTKNLIKYCACYDYRIIKNNENIYIYRFFIKYNKEYYIIDVNNVSLLIAISSIISDNNDNNIDFHDIIISDSIRVAKIQAGDNYALLVKPTNEEIFIILYSPFTLNCIFDHYRTIQSYNDKHRPRIISIIQYCLEKKFNNLHNKTGFCKLQNINICDCNIDLTINGADNLIAIQSTNNDAYNDIANYVHMSAIILHIYKETDLLLSFDAFEK